MSGHSKWSTIKRQKGVADARRSAVFTKYSRMISVAARAGGKDPAMNFNLRLAIDKAKSVNMPNDNIERAIKSGAGELKDAQTKEALYEGFGPGGVAVMIQALTDNSNRTNADLRNLMQKHGGSLGGQNSVAWMFQLRGVIHVSVEHLPVDQSRSDLELAVIDAGAEDVRDEDGGLMVVIPVDRLAAIKTWFETKHITPDEADIAFVPTTTVAIDDQVSQKLQQLLTALDEHPDVTNMYTNDA